MALLRREVLVPVPSHRRPSTLIGMSIAMVLVASAADAVIWSYQAKRQAEEQAAREMMRPVPVRWQAGEVRQVRDAGPHKAARVEPSLSVIKPVDDSVVRLRCDPADPLCGL